MTLLHKGAKIILPVKYVHLQMLKN